MHADRRVTPYQAPNTCSNGSLILIAALGTDHALRGLDLTAGGRRRATHLAVYPMVELPAPVQGDALASERVVVFCFLGDLHAEAGLAPALDDALRGPYRRWMLLYAASFEPAVAYRALKRAPAPSGTSTYGDGDTLLRTLTGWLVAVRYLRGERLCAADMVWVALLAWTMMLELVPALPPIKASVGRIDARPAATPGRGRDTGLTAK